MSKSPRTQRGYAALIAVLIALAFTASLIATFTWLANQRARDTYADIEGQALSQFAVGLRGFVAAVQADPAKLPANLYVVTGVNWLKAPTCGGLTGNPAEGFVPCHFTGETLGSQYRTTIRRDAMTNRVEARTVVRVPPQGGDPQSVILMADKVAEAALRQQSLPANGMFYTAWGNVAETATAPAGVVPAAADAGQVLLLVSNAPSNDLWLRVDGTNSMQANLNMGGFSIGNARDASFAGDVRVQGRQQIDNGLTVTNGVADLQSGLITTDAVLTSIGRFASQGIYSARVLYGSSSYVVPKPNCTQAGNSPAIYAAFQATGSVNFDGNYRGDAMYDARVDVTDLGASWQVTPVVRGTQFTMAMNGADITLTKALNATNPADARIVVLTRCR